MAKINYMKLVKLTKFGTLSTSIDGSLYILSDEAITVEDSIASRLKEQFLHDVEVSDIITETKEDTVLIKETPETEIVESKPKKIGRINKKK